MIATSDNRQEFSQKEILSDLKYDLTYGTTPSMYEHLTHSLVDQKEILMKVLILMKVVMKALSILIIKNFLLIKITWKIPHLTPKMALKIAEFIIILTEILI